MAGTTIIADEGDAIVSPVLSTQMADALTALLAMLHSSPVTMSAVYRPPRWRLYPAGLWSKIRNSDTQLILSGSKDAEILFALLHSNFHDLAYSGRIADQIPGQ